MVVVVVVVAVKGGAARRRRADTLSFWTRRGGVGRETGVERERRVRKSLVGRCKAGRGTWAVDPRL